MTTDLAIVDDRNVLAPGIDVTAWTDALIMAARIADRVADTEFVPAAMRGKPDVVAAAIMYGAEVGVGPMQALAGLHIVEGRPQPSAELMRAMILRAGHTFTVHEMSGTRVRVSGLRRGEPESERFPVEWTIDMARAAGLLNKNNWRNYPRAMLLARATGDLARAKFPDVVKGLGYVAEDVSAGDLDGWALSPGPPVEEPAPRKRLQRRKAATVTPPEPAPEPEPAAPATPDVRDGGDAGGEATRPRPVPEPVDTPDEIRRRYDELARADDDGPVVDNGPTVDDVPLPDLEPEAPTDEPPAVGPRMIGPGQLKAVQAALTAELGTVATREEKHAMLAGILDHPVESTKDLTRDEAFRVLDVIGRIQDGSMRWTPDLATGAITITDVRQPPPEQEGPDDEA